MSAVLQEVAARFDALAEVVPLHRIRSDAEYNQAIESLNLLLDNGGADERHRLADLVHILGELIEDYEEASLPPPAARGVDALRFLMDQHNLRQSDLPEIGSQGVVSEILSGQRELRMAHIRFLSERFGVPGDVFL